MTHTTETEGCIFHRTSSPCFGNCTSPGFLEVGKEDFVCLDRSSLDSPPASPLLSSLPSSPSSSSPSTSLDGSIEKASSPTVEKFGLVFTSASATFVCKCLPLTYRVKRMSSATQKSRLIIGLLHWWRRKRPWRTCWALRSPLRKLKNQLQNIFPRKLLRLLMHGFYPE